MRKGNLGPVFKTRMLRRVAAGAVALLAASTVAAQPADGACRPVAASPDQASNAQIRRIEQGLVPAITSSRTKPQTLAARMRYFEVPGISVAVIHNGKLDWARAWGVRDISNCEPVTVDTAFQAASISKTVAALVAMRLVEQGKLELDTDINDALKTWKLPRNEALAPGFVTLRQILSHTAGTTVHGFAGYAEGEALPSLVQILEGAPPANSPAVRMELPPGKQFQYSGGGFLVAQLAMSDVTGVSYDELAARDVFRPLGMRRSSVAAIPSGEILKDAAHAHSGGRVVKGGFHYYPELAVAALWTTPTDLARMLMDVQAAARGESATLLKPETARLMLAPQSDGGAIAAGWSLGWSLAGSGDERRFGHDGRNEGFESTMTAFVTRGEGVVVLTNADRGKQLADELVRAVANAYGWTGLASREVAEVEVPIKVLQRYPGFYSTGPLQVWIDARDRDLYARIGGATGEKLLALSPTRFIAEASGAVAEFESDANGSITGLRIVEGGPQVTLARTAAPAAQLGATPLFLRGSMNDWSTQHALTPVSDGVFAIEMPLVPGDWEFKIASDDWTSVDLGVAGGTPAINQDATAIKLLSRGANIRVSVRDSGLYRFTLTSAANGDPTLAVRRIGN